MRNITKRLANAPYRLMAAVSAAAMMAGEAHAQDVGIGRVANSFNNQMDTMGKTVLGVSFLAGLGFVGAGLLKLKAAADSQGREPYGPGIWRMGAGAGLVGLPAMAGIFRDTATGGENNINVQTGTATFN